MQSIGNWSKLPLECGVEIVKNLQDPKDIIALGQVCKIFRDAVINFGQGLFGESFTFQTALHIWAPIQLTKVQLNDQTYWDELLLSVFSNRGMNYFKSHARTLRLCRGEKGIDFIRKQPIFAQTAAVCFAYEKQRPTAHLLITYGVIPDMNCGDMIFTISGIVARGDRSLLELLSKRCKLIFTKFRDENNWSLSDLALIGGQFELEEFFAKKEKVPYTDIEGDYQDLCEGISQAIKWYGSAAADSIHINQGCFYDWPRFLKIMDHYLKHRSEQILLACAVGLLDACKEYHHRKMTSRKDYSINRLSEVANALIPRGVKLEGEIGSQPAMEWLKSNCH